MKKFASVARPKPEMLAMADPITSVCDYHPDICASVNFWNNFEAESRNLAKTQAALTLGNLLVKGLEYEKKTRPFSYNGTPKIKFMRQELLAVHTVTKFMEETGCQVAEDSLTNREYAEVQAQGELAPVALCFDLMDSSTPRLHLSRSVLEHGGITAPKEGGRPRWSKKNELYVQTKYPADMTPDFVNLQAQQGVGLDPAEYVTAFPMLARRSTLGVDHTCTVPSIPVALLIKPPEAGK